MMNVTDIGMTFVKCTRFLTVDAVRLELHGLAGDREFILVDRHGGLMPAHHHGLFSMLSFRFDPASERLVLTFPGGRVVEGSGAAVGGAMALDYLGMRTIDVCAVEGDWDRLLTEHAGRPVRMVRSVRAGGGIDVLPVTFFTTGSLHALSERMGGHIDPRRFRANFVIDHDQPFAEDDWDRRLLRIGEALLRVRSPVPRCAVTHVHPDSGANDAAIVPILGKFRERVRLPDGLMPSYATPGFASYAEVLEPGTVRRGDEARLIDAID